MLAGTFTPSPIAIAVRSLLYLAGPVPAVWVEVPVPLGKTTRFRCTGCGVETKAPTTLCMRLGRNAPTCRHPEDHVYAHPAGWLRGVGFPVAPWMEAA